MGEDQKRSIASLSILWRRRDRTRRNSWVLPFFFYGLHSFPRNILSSDEHKRVFDGNKRIRSYTSGRTDYKNFLLPFILFFWCFLIYLFFFFIFRRCNLNYIFSYHDDIFSRSISINLLLIYKKNIPYSIFSFIIFVRKFSKKLYRFIYVKHQIVWYVIIEML